MRFHVISWGKTSTHWCWIIDISPACQIAETPTRQWVSSPTGKVGIQLAEWNRRTSTVKNTHTHSRLTALCPGLPRWAGTRKVKPVWILLKQETVSGSGSGISWAICSSQVTTPAPHHSSFFKGRMPFLPPNQQHRSTEGNHRQEYSAEFGNLASQLARWPGG